MPIQFLADTYFSCLYRLPNLASAEQRQEAFRITLGPDNPESVPAEAHFRINEREWT